MIYILTARRMTEPGIMQNGLNRYSTIGSVRWNPRVVQVYWRASWICFAIG